MPAWSLETVALRNSASTDNDETSSGGMRFGGEGMLIKTAFHEIQQQHLSWCNNSGAAGAFYFLDEWR